MASLPFMKYSSSQQEFQQTFDEIQLLKDSLTALDRSRLILDLEEKYESHLKEKEISNLKLNKQNQSYLIAGILLFSLISIGFLFHRHRLRNKLKDQQIAAEKAQNEHLEKKARWEEEEKILRDEIIQQQKQELIRTSDEIHQLEEKVTELIQKSQSEANKQMLVEFNKLKADRYFLENFMGSFNHIYPNYISRLKLRHAVLTTSDLQFCALIRMNLSYKEIASILSIELTSVYRKKYRIEEKLELKGEEIELYLQGI
jgi:DNA-binding CsgD family transcriptional regulator